MQTWKDKHPAWSFMRWDNDLLSHFPFVNRNKIDECMKKGLYHGVSDIMGYEILYNYGGFIAKADTICLNPIDELMDIKENCFTSYVNEREQRGVEKNLLSLHLATVKGCPLMKELTEALRLRKKRIKEPWLATGNLFFTNFVLRSKYPIKIYPSYFFSPTFYDGTKYTGKGKIYSEHFWGTTNKLY